MRIIFAIVIAVCIFDLPIQAQEESDVYYTKYEKQLKSGILCMRRERVDYRQDTAWRLWIYTDSVSTNDTGLFFFTSQEISYLERGTLDTQYAIIKQYDHNKKILFEKSRWKPTFQDSGSEEIVYAYDEKGRLIEKKENISGKQFTKRDVYSYDDDKRTMVYTLYGDSNNVEYESLNLYDSLFRLKAVYPTYINQNQGIERFRIGVSKRIGEVSVSYEYQDSGKKVIENNYYEKRISTQKTTEYRDSIRIESHLIYDEEGNPDSIMIEDRYDMTGARFDSKSINLKTGKTKKIYSDPTDVNSKTYDSNNRLVSIRYGNDSSFSGTTYSYNESGDISEMVTYRNGRLFEIHKFTYTYAK